MLKSCKYCGRIHDSRYDCGKRPRKQYRRKASEAGRYTYAWQLKSREIKERSHYLCAYCLAHGELTYDDLEVHHIVKLTDRPDLLLEDGNLICLCARHHERAESGEIPKKELYELVKTRDDPPGGVEG